MNCLHCNKNYCMSFVPIFQVLNRTEMEEISKIISRQTFKKGEPIVLAGEMKKRFFVVHRGKVKITHISEDGREQVIRIMRAGDFFGDLSLFKNTPLTTNAEALETVEICMLEGGPFKEILRKTPDLLLNILEHLSERLEKAEFQLSQMSTQDVGQRLAAFILEQATDSNQDIFELPVNKTDAASLLGTSRETLSRKLSFFQKQGYIKMSGRKVQICDRAALERML
ncbi:MAG: Crp/Fnr family transcriptional regulator [Bacillus sp. (in: firmicutes)]